MIAVDTNILVYAHRADATRHAAAYRSLDELILGNIRWCIPWPCVHEFIGVVTRNIYQPPSSLEQAFAFLRELTLGKNFSGYIGEGAHHLTLLEQLARQADLHGAQIHDARIAAICIAHGVTELWTADRDFLLFPDLRVRNPLVSSINE